MNKIQKEFKDKTGKEPYYYDEYGDNGKIFYNDYVLFLERKILNAFRYSDYPECKCTEFEMTYRCKKCGSTRLHPMPD